MPDTVTRYFNIAESAALIFQFEISIYFFLVSTFPLSWSRKPRREFQRPRSPGDDAKVPAPPQPWAEAAASPTGQCHSPPALPGSQPVGAVSWGTRGATCSSYTRLLPLSRAKSFQPRVMPMCHYPEPQPHDQDPHLQGSRVSHSTGFKGIQLPLAWLDPCAHKPCSAPPASVPPDTAPSKTRELEFKPSQKPAQNTPRGFSVEVFVSVRHEPLHRDAARGTQGRAPIPVSLQSPRTPLAGGQEAASSTDPPWEHQGAKPVTDLGNTGRAALATVASRAEPRTGDVLITKPFIWASS